MAFIFYRHHLIELEHMREALAYRMKNHTFFFDDAQFRVDIVTDTDNAYRIYEIYEDEATLYMLAPLPYLQNEKLKVAYPKAQFAKEVEAFTKALIMRFVAFSVLSALIAFLFSWYALYPLRKSITLLKTFMKDLVHHLHTPLGNIVLNLEMVSIPKEEKRSIQSSIKEIRMLHEKLIDYLRYDRKKNERFSLNEVIGSVTQHFMRRYDALRWQIRIEDRVLYSDKYAFERICYNLLSNAAAYNIPGGFVEITTDKHTLYIRNTTRGIKEPKRIFEHFYKESDRGLGIGLPIVKRLCDTLGIKLSFRVERSVVTVALDLEKVTLS